MVQGPAFGWRIVHADSGGIVVAKNSTIIIRRLLRGHTSSNGLKLGTTPGGARWRPRRRRHLRRGGHHARLGVTPNSEDASRCYARVEDNEWYCLNDNNVTTVGIDDTLTEQAYGGHLVHLPTLRGLVW